MSEQYDKPEVQKPVVNNDGTLLGMCFYLGGGLCFLVAFGSAIGAITGMKLSMKGAAIPGEWWFAATFVVLGLMSFGTAWVYELPAVQRVFRNHKWIWFPLLGGIVLGCWGLVIAINIWDAGGFMMYAVNHGDAKKVESYLKDGKVDKPTQIKMLRRAVSKRKASVVKLMLAQGVDPNTKAREWNKKSPHGNRLFHRACRNGGLEMVKAFVEKGADLNATNAKGQSPLYFATTQSWGIRPAKQRLVVEFLLKKGAKFKGKLSRYQRRNLERKYPQLSSKILGQDADSLGQPNIKVPARLPTKIQPPKRDLDLGLDKELKQPTKRKTNEDIESGDDDEE